MLSKIDHICSLIISKVRDFSLETKYMHHGRKTLFRHTSLENGLYNANNDQSIEKEIK